MLGPLPCLFQLFHVCRGYLSGSTPSAQNSTYNVPADLQELEAEVMSANSLAGIRRKVYGSKKDTFTIDSLVMMEMVFHFFLVLCVCLVQVEVVVTGQIPECNDSSSDRQAY
jgi:hypothetical protein